MNLQMESFAGSICLMTWFTFCENRPWPPRWDCGTAHKVVLAAPSPQPRPVRAHGPESCTSERSLLQLVPLIWPKIYGATPLPPSKRGLGHPKLKKSLGHFWHNFLTCDDVIFTTNPGLLLHASLSLQQLGNFLFDLVSAQSNCHCSAFYTGLDGA